MILYCQYCTNKYCNSDSLIPHWYHASMGYRHSIRIIAIPWISIYMLSVGYRTVSVYRYRMHTGSNAIWHNMRPVTGINSVTGTGIRCTRVACYCNTSINTGIPVAILQSWNRRHRMSHSTYSVPVQYHVQSPMCLTAMQYLHVYTCTLVGSYCNIHMSIVHAYHGVWHASCLMIPVPTRSR